MNQLKVAIVRQSFVFKTREFKRSDILLIYNKDENNYYVHAQNTQTRLNFPIPKSYLDRYAD